MSKILGRDQKHNLTDVITNFSLIYRFPTSIPIDVLLQMHSACKLATTPEEFARQIFLLQWAPQKYRAHKQGPLNMYALGLSEFYGTCKFLKYVHKHLTVVWLTSLGSLLRHMATNSLKALLKFPASSGGLFLGIKNKTLIGWRSEFGGSPLASSIAVIPRDQISAYVRGNIIINVVLQPLLKAKSFMSITYCHSIYSINRGLYNYI